MAFNLCTSEAIVRKAGVFVNAIASASSALLEQISNEAEGELCASTHKDWITDIADVPANIKTAVAKAVSSRAGMALIGYDTSGYMKTDVQITLDILNDEWEKGVAVLKDKNLQKFN